MSQNISRLQDTGEGFLSEIDREIALEKRIVELTDIVTERNEQISYFKEIITAQEANLVTLNSQFAIVEAKYQAIAQSTFWKLTAPLRSALNKSKSLTNLGRRFVRAQTRPAIQTQNLEANISVNSSLAPLRAFLPRQAEMTRSPSQPSDLTVEPVISLNQMQQQPFSISFVVAVTSNDGAALERTIQSILRQTDPTWELLLCAGDDATDIANAWLDIDWRIRCPPDMSDERHILVPAAFRSTCDYVGIITQGDLIEDDLVKMILKTADSELCADIIYTDESRFLESGVLGEHFFKPDWSPEHFDSVNYLGRFVAIRKSLLLNTVKDKALSTEVLEYALLRNIVRHARKIIHLDDALYVRVTHTNLPLGFFPKSAISEARTIVEQHIQKENPGASVTANVLSGALQVTWPVPPDTPVTLVILTGMRRRKIPGRGDIVLATHFVKSIIEKSTYKGYKILVVDDGFVPQELGSLLAEHGHKSCSYENGKGPFSFARKANFAVRSVSEGIVILLNDDLEIITPHWIEALAGFAARSGVGAVGARLLHIDNTVQHAGLILGYHGSVGHMLHKSSADGSEYGGFASIERNFSAVTAAAIAFRRDVFDEIGGFDEVFRVDYNDVDFCLRLGAAGYRVVMTPAATLYHFHNSSFQRDHDDSKEREVFVERWKEKIERDPYFNKHFQRKHHELPLIYTDIEVY